MRHAPHHILKTVAMTHGVTVEDIKGPCRKRRISDARKMTFAMLYEYSDLTACERADFMGKDRTTGIFAVNTHYDLLDSHPDYKAKCEQVVQRLKQRERAPRQLYAGRIILPTCRA